MSLSKQPLNNSNVNELNLIRKNANISQSGCIITIVILVLMIVLFYKNHFNDILPFLAIAVFISFFLLFFVSIESSNIDTDISENLKLVGTINVKKKHVYDDDESTLIHYFIIFDDWRIGEKTFKKDYWEKIELNQEFYVEQTINSEYIFELKSENIDFKQGLLSNLKEYKN